MSIHLNFPLLRKLRPAEIHPPRKFGDWYVLLRLDHFSPARFDDSMRSFLLNQQLESFLTKRVECILNGETPDRLHYDN